MDCMCLLLCTILNPTLTCYVLFQAPITLEEDDCFEPKKRHQKGSKRQARDVSPEPPEKPVDPKVHLRATFTKENYNKVTLCSLYLQCCVRVNNAVCSHTCLLSELQIKNNGIAQMMASDRTQKIDELRQLFGATANFIDVTKAELSDQVDTLEVGEFKTKMFNMAKAKTLVDTFDKGKLNKANFMIRSDPSSINLEKKLQQQLASCKSPNEAQKAFNTIASVSHSTFDFLDTTQFAYSVWLTYHLSAQHCRPDRCFVAINTTYVFAGYQS